MKKAWYIILVIILLAGAGLAKWAIDRSTHPVAGGPVNTNTVVGATLYGLCNDCDFLGSDAGVAKVLDRNSQTWVSVPHVQALYDTLGSVSMIAMDYSGDLDAVTSTDLTSLSLVALPADTNKPLYTVPTGMAIVIQPTWTVDEQHLVFGVGKNNAAHDYAAVTTTSVVAVDVHTGAASTLLQLSDPAFKGLSSVSLLGATSDLGRVAFIGWAHLGDVGANYVYDVATKKLTKLTMPYAGTMRFVRAGDPNAEGDGRQLAGRLMWIGEDKAVHFMRLDTLAEVSWPLSADGIQDYTLSPTGRWLFFRRLATSGMGTDVVRLDTASGETTIIAHGLQTGVESLSYAMWTPDESAFIIPRTDERQPYEVMQDVGGTPYRQPLNDPNLPSTMSLSRLFYPRPLP